MYVYSNHCIICLVLFGQVQQIPPLSPTTQQQLYFKHCHNVFGLTNKAPKSMFYWYQFKQCLQKHKSKKYCYYCMFPCQFQTTLSDHKPVHNSCNWDDYLALFS